MSLQDDKQQNIRDGTGLLVYADTGEASERREGKRIELSGATNGTENPASTESTDGGSMWWSEKT